MFGFKTKALAAAEIKDAIQTFDVIAHCYGGREVVGAITAVNEADAFDAAFAEPGKWFGTGQVEYVTVATAA